MNTTEARRRLQSTQFPAGIPRLWCPTLTHFQSAAEPDAARIHAHLRQLAPFVKGLLVPGSTGEGWEMTDADIRKLLGIVLDAAQDSRMQVLVGVLKTNTEAVLECLDSMQDFLEHPAVAGVVVCPPKGKELSQLAIHQDLARVLRCGRPTALYQLPQVTENEMSADTVAELANEFPNFILFKDTSGTDLVAQSSRELGGVFMVRGSEQGGYASWTRGARGPYDGFLLSTANVFASELDSVLRLLDAGNIEAAQVLSSRLEEVVQKAFAMVSAFPVGNAFANANKVLDHCLAHGAAAGQYAPPLLYSGESLPVRFIDAGVSLLREHSLLPERGYCE
jgi:dihydrodipicolinate synthase/N-acetylneuraminate lyase